MLKSEQKDCKDNTLHDIYQISGTFFCTSFQLLWANTLVRPDSFEQNQTRTAFAKIRPALKAGAKVDIRN